MSSIIKQNHLDDPESQSNTFLEGHIKDCLVKTLGYYEIIFYR